MYGYIHLLMLLNAVKVYICKWIYANISYKLSLLLELILY